MHTAMYKNVIIVPLGSVLRPSRKLVTPENILFSLLTALLF